MSRRAGYTLIELMVIVVIIGISAVVFAPGLGRAMADRRVSTAARELIRIGRRARSDTLGYLRAHLIWIVPATGTVQLLRGSTNSCTLSSWVAIQTDCPAITVPPTAPGNRCLENVNLQVMTTDSTLRLYEEQLSGANVTSYSQPMRALCYAPSGLVYWGTGTDLATSVASLTDANSATVRGGFVYTLHTGTGVPVATSRVHRILFPLGGTARSLR